MAKTKKSKSPSAKEVMKNEVANAVKTALENLGFEIDTDHEAYGFTKGTVVVKGENADVQIKFMTPKAGVDHYEKEEDEESEEENA